jgi:capsular polysaccharide export protein
MDPASRVLPVETRGKYELTNQTEKQDGSKIVFLYSSGRWNASGLYLQDLTRNLVRLGDQCMILAEGDIPDGGAEDGVLWRTFDFDGYLMAKPLKDEVLAFNPDVVFVINVRLKPMRAALELHVACGAKIAVQSEDDDLLIYEKFHKYADRELLQILDTPEVSHEDIELFCSKIRWDYTLDILTGKRAYRDVEPILRTLCYKLSILNTAIWHPLQNKLKASFGKAALVIPPVVEMADFDPVPFSSEKRSEVLRKYKIDPKAMVIFLGGTIYDFSPEFEIFIECLNLAAESTPLCLVVSGRSRVDVKGVVGKKLSGNVGFASMGVPPDAEYFDMMKAADVIAAPGVPDIFNELRLSSRLVKAMAFGKPIFTYRCGFGESLEDGVNAVLTDGENAMDWATKLLTLADEQTRIEIGRNGRTFAEQHFDAPDVALKLSKCLRPMKGVFPSSLKTAKRQNEKLKSPPKSSAPKSRFVRKMNKLRRNPRQFFADAWYCRAFRDALNK